MKAKNLVTIVAVLAIITGVLAAFYADELSTRLRPAQRGSREVNTQIARNNALSNVRYYGEIYEMEGNCMPKIVPDESEGEIITSQVGKSAFTGPCTNKPLTNKAIELRELPLEDREMKDCRETPLVVSGKTDSAGKYSLRAPLGNNQGAYILVFDYPLVSRPDFCAAFEVKPGINERITLRAKATF
mgnify:CR=1 FL=1